MRCGHFVADSHQFVTLKFDQFAAPGTVEVIMLRIAVIVVKYRATIELKTV